MKGALGWVGAVAGMTVVNRWWTRRRNARVRRRMTERGWHGYPGFQRPDRHP